MSDLKPPVRPAERPARPWFSSGPCPKRPGWSPSDIRTDMLGRSHRSKPGKERLAEAITRTRALLGVPDDYRIGIVPASDTGAMELAMWSLLGARGADMLAWESFGAGWVTDAAKQLQLDPLRIFEAPYGSLPDLSEVNPDHDVVFTWNGTTSGVRVPDADWISAARTGLTLCDATSAVFAQDLDWPKLDVVTYSWQKVLGGEAAHGMLILSPRAVERLETYAPPRPLPKIFRLTKNGKLMEGIFRGETINTPSMWCVEDYLDALAWAERIGGLPALQARADANLAAVTAWAGKTPWVEFLCADPAYRSNTSVCLKLTEEWLSGQDGQTQWAVVKRLAALLEDETVAYDIAGHRDGPPGLRIWCGATVETADVKALLPWIEWAFAAALAEIRQAA